MPAAPPRADVSRLVSTGVQSGLDLRATMIEAANTNTLIELETRLKQYEFQEAARLVTAVKMLLEAAEGRMEATVIHVKAPHAGFDTYVQLRLHTLGADIREVQLPQHDIFAFTVREKQNIALGRGQQNPREETVKKPVEPPKPSAATLAMKRLYNSVAPSIGLKPVRLEPKPVAAAAEVAPLSLEQQVDGIIMEAGKWCAVRGHIRKSGLAATAPAPVV